MDSDGAGRAHRSKRVVPQSSRTTVLKQRPNVSRPAVGEGVDLGEQANGPRAAAADVRRQRGRELDVVVDPVQGQRTAPRGASRRPGSGHGPVEAAVSCFVGSAVVEGVVGDQGGAAGPGAQQQHQRQHHLLHDQLSTDLELTRMQLTRIQIEKR